MKTRNLVALCVVIVLSVWFSYRANDIVEAAWPFVSFSIILIVVSVSISISIWCISIAVHKFRNVPQQVIITKEEDELDRLESYPQADEPRQLPPPPSLEFEWRIALRRLGVLWFKYGMTDAALCPRFMSRLDREAVYRFLISRGVLVIQKKKTQWGPGWGLERYREEVISGDLLTPLPSQSPPAIKWPKQAQ